MLHTADWHLGQKFFHTDTNREEEHKAVLKWLTAYIVEQEIELLVIAGDIFDTNSPPNYARKMYFDFMQGLANTPCHDVVVIAGNHDSPNMLDASKKLLASINVYVVGHISKDQTEQIIEIKDKNGALKAVVGAVPYLRDRDIRKNAAGESIEQRRENLRKGIIQHYAEIDAALQEYYKREVPVIVTGHLYVAGAQRGERPNTIHIGSLELVEPSVFPLAFTYVALGHLHRPQKVGNQNRIQYSGTLIPIDFSELNYDQVVKLVHFKKETLESVQDIKVPKFRKLRFYKGTVKEIKKRLREIDTEVDLPTWIKVDVITDSYLPNLQEELTGLIDVTYAELLICNQKLSEDLLGEGAEEESVQSLKDISYLEIFELCLDQKGIYEEKERADLVNSFKELLSWMEEQDQE